MKKIVFEFLGEVDYGDQLPSDHCPFCGHRGQKYGEYWQHYCEIVRKPIIWQEIRTATQQH